MSDSVTNEPSSLPGYGLAWTPEEEIGFIEAALDAVLAEVISSDTRRMEAAKGHRPLFHRVKLSDPIPTRRQGRILDLVRDPSGVSLRFQVRELGNRLHELGGIPAMERVCDAIEERHETTNGGRRAVIMDKAWNGIGDDKGMWWA